MKPKQIWGNLAVADLHRTAEFYSALGFKQNTGMPEPADLVSFSFGEDAFVINFFQKEKFEANTGMRFSDGKAESKSCLPFLRKAAKRSMIGQKKHGPQVLK